VLGVGEEGARNHADDNRAVPAARQ
jgi:hypothetical protein